MPPRGAFNREGRLTQNSIQRGASIRYGALIGSWVFIRSFTVMQLGILQIWVCSFALKLISTNIPVSSILTNSNPTQKSLIISCFFTEDPSIHHFWC